MSSSESGWNEPGLENWSLFLRQRRLQDQLRRLKNDFKSCYCPATCRGLPEQHVVSDPLAEPIPPIPPAQPLHGPYVAVDSDLPDTWARPDALRGPGASLLAEARGTSDIRLHRTGERATLRMSMQVRADPTRAGRIGYFGEMFLTQHGRPEVFIGFIQAWYMDRRRIEGRRFWEEIYLDDYGERYTRWRDNRNDIEDHRNYFLRLFGEFFGNWEMAERDDNGNLLPDVQYRGNWGGAWARANEDTDIIYIPLIWIDQQFRGQRIIDQGFELFWRLMTGGSLPEPYNVTRPLSAFLEAGELSPPWGQSNDSLTSRQRLQIIARAYERNGFMLLSGPGDSFFYLGRRIDSADYAGPAAAAGDTAIVPPTPSNTNLSTPSPSRLSIRKTY
ncbi:hypothetical protein KVR01_012229 [Diaporthe batatas]|uniref:uncharacterized protein n=1 Tax=Diaporthe batatas TaxID=748121 RepID=UPI001D03FC04|nr:uncharacterized protein KVR01_012229 [Diaporthe batatas]KAG8157957.1 hypothetical protein KVR01_012229 [Diaporthe batatas]